MTAAARKKDAVVRELASMGVTRKRMAELIGIAPSIVSSLCKRAGVNPPREGGGWEPHRAKARDRAMTMAALYSDGRTLGEIGDAFGITRERVRQLISKYTDVTSSDGGESVKAARRKEARRMARDAKSLRLWGCSWEQYAALRAMKKPTRAYSYQKNNARRRGIQWNFTLLSWWTVWQASGKWDQRGRGSGYVMCRKGDTGPYSPDNVYIATGAQNSFDGQCNSGRHDPSLPMGVRKGQNGKFRAVREGRYLGTFPTVELARAAYIRNDASQAIAARNRSGLPSGVRRNARNNSHPFSAYFYVGAKQVHVGSFSSVDEAVAARMKAKNAAQVAGEAA